MSTSDNGGRLPRGRVPSWALALFCGLWCAGFYVAAFPNLDLAEGAFVFAVPFAIWAASAPRWRIFLPTAFLSGWLAWAVLVVWLRNLPIPFAAAWGAFLGLGLVTGLFLMAWLAGLRLVLPRVLEASISTRLVALAGLAGFWVFLEWLRTWLLTGFPWLPLAAAFWENPLMLSLLPWTGSWGLSFVLVFFNLGLAVRLRQFWPRVRRRQGGRGLCPEFYVALIALVAGPFAGLLTGSGVTSGEDNPGFRAALIQPDIPAELKWAPGMAEQAWASVREKTRDSLVANPEVIFWPETAAPGAIEHYGTDGKRRAVEALVRAAGVPLLTGDLGRPSVNELYNGVFLVEPEAGLSPRYQAKRKLVPFGEYTPLEGILPLDKVVPIEIDTNAGDAPVLLDTQVAGQPWRFGALVCYEDIFPHLARELVNEGADILYVATNNGWYGEEAGAYQHAAHSVLRAAELRRPVVRCGNNGWSGWIDENGRIRFVFLPDEGKTIYAGGWTVVQVEAQSAWRGRLTLYAKWGDWFVAVCALLMLATVAVCRRGKVAEPTSKSPGA